MEDKQDSQICLLNYKSLWAYNVNLNKFEEYKRLIRGKTPKNVCGYAIELKRNGKWYLYALFVKNNRVYFLAKGHLFDVTTNKWNAIKNKKGLFTYEFILSEGNDIRLKEFYREFTESTTEDMDPHFFVDVIHWLKNAETKDNLKGYWFEKNNQREQTL